MIITEFKALPKPRRKPVQRESQLQQACVRWFRLTYPQYRDLLFSIPNGGHRNKITAARMKAEGQVAGVPDLMLAVPMCDDGLFHGLFIELKAGKNTPSQAQNEIIKNLKYKGYCVEVCNSLESFQLAVKQYLS